MERIDSDLEYASKCNIFKDGEQNSQEWTEMFIRLRDEYGALQCDPKTGLGVDYGGVRSGRGGS